MGTVNVRSARTWLFLAGFALACAVSPARAQGGPGDDETPPPAPSEAQEDAPPDAQPPREAPAPPQLEERLSGYGQWVYTPEYGRVWVPGNDLAQSDWRPYTDGHWVYTRWGWSFVSDAPWGAVVYHYGRWGYRERFGWFWVPGVVWAPAWVAWRYQQGYFCWSPYAPGGYYGDHWHGWVVVREEHIYHHVTAYVVPWSHAEIIVRAALPYRFEHGGWREEHHGWHEHEWREHERRVHEFRAQEHVWREHDGESRHQSPGPQRLPPERAPRPPVHENQPPRHWSQPPAPARLPPQPARMPPEHQGQPDQPPQHWSQPPAPARMPPQHWSRPPEPARVPQPPARMPPQPARLPAEHRSWSPPQQARGPSLPAAVAQARVSPGGASSRGHHGR